MNEEKLHDRIRGAFFAGAYGDALGYAAEMSEDTNLTNLHDDDGGEYLRLKVESKAIISQNTQLALFTANGLLFGITRYAMRGIGADLSNYVEYAFDEWKQTQTGSFDKEKYHTCWIRDIAGLNKQRKCTTFGEFRVVIHPKKNPELALTRLLKIKEGNDIVFNAPIGLFYASSSRYNTFITIKDIFNFANPYKKSCAATFFSSLLFKLCLNDEYVSKNTFIQLLKNLSNELLIFFEQSEDITKTLKYVNNAISAAQDNTEEELFIESLDNGWKEDSALSIALYYTIRYYDNFEETLRHVLKKARNRDVICSICGYIIGSIKGYGCFTRYNGSLELVDLILTIADDIYSGCCISEYATIESREQQQWFSRYVEILPCGLSPD